MTIREARTDDAGAIFAVTEAAFGRPGEARLVDALREGGDVVLSLVAEGEGGGIDGHVLFTRLAIETGASPPSATALAPVSVAAARQRAGLGSALVREALARLASSGEDIVFVLGDPAYYGRFGFDAALGSRFSCPWPGPYFMALALRPLEDAALAGRVVYPAPFMRLG